MVAAPVDGGKMGSGFLPKMNIRERSRSKKTEFAVNFRSMPVTSCSGYDEGEVKLQ